MRLAAVQHFLPLAAEQSDENIEYVHQLRVATRRCVAALRLYRKILPKLPRKTLCRELKSIRQAAGRARDYDVLILRHSAESPDASSQHFLEEVRKKRCEAQQPLRDIHAVVGGESAFAAVAARTIRAGARRFVGPTVPTFGSWARRQLRKSVKAFFAAEPPELNDLEALHQVSYPRQGAAVRHGTAGGRLSAVLSNPALSVGRTAAGSARRNQRSCGRSQTIPQLEYRDQ